MKPLISVLVLASLFLAGTASAAAKTYYVSTNGLHEVNGVVWGTYTTSDGVDHDAYTNLQQVISAAANGSTIWVEDGFTVSEGSTFYRGKDLMPLYPRYGSKLNLGDPYYRNKTYSRTDLVFHIVSNRFVDLTGSLVFHASDKTTGFWQQVSCRFYIDNRLWKRRGDNEYLRSGRLGQLY